MHKHNTGVRKVSINKQGCVYLSGGIPKDAPVVGETLRRLGNTGTTRNKDAAKLAVNIAACIENGIVMGPGSPILDIMDSKRPTMEQYVAYARKVLNIASDPANSHIIALTPAWETRFQAVIDNPCKETFSAVSVTNVLGGTLEQKANCSLFQRLRDTLKQRQNASKQ